MTERYLMRSKILLGCDVRCLMALGVALLCLVGPLPSGAEDQGAYSFVLLAEQPSVFKLSSLGRPSINNRGSVAFLDRFQGIRIVNDRISELVASRQEFAFGNLAAINDAGRVAFYAKPPCPEVQCPGGILVGDERTLTFVVDPNDPNFSFTHIVDPTLNNRGTVAFVDQPHDVFAVGHQGTQLLGHFDIGPNSAGGSVIIADSGLVVFPAFVDFPSRLVLVLYDGQELMSLAEFDGSDEIRIFSADVSNSGQVVFSVGPCCSVGEHRIYMWERGHLELLATVPSFVFAVAINNRGKIAFNSASGNPQTGVDTLSALEDGQIKRIVGPGDSLFGRTVSRIEFSEAGTGLNDAGQLAFNVLFADGGAAVVRADPH